MLVLYKKQFSQISIHLGNWSGKSGKFVVANEWEPYFRVMVRVQGLEWDKKNSYQCPSFSLKKFAKTLKLTLHNGTNWPVSPGIHLYVGTAAVPGHSGFWDLQFEVCWDTGQSGVQGVLLWLVRNVGINCRLDSEIWWLVLMLLLDTWKHVYLFRVSFSA